MHARAFLTVKTSINSFHFNILSWSVPRLLALDHISDYGVLAGNDPAHSRGFVNLNYFNLADRSRDLAQYVAGCRILDFPGDPFN